MSLRGTPLTERQAHILHLVSLGHGKQKIAKTLHLSEGTVGTHLARTYEKLDAVDSAHAVLIACHEGVLGPDALDYRFVEEYRRSRHASHRRRAP